MKLVSKKIEEIKVYENNPIVHTEEQITKLASLIKEYGFKQPIVIDKNNVIVAGHGRLEACKKLKFEEILCVIADDLTEEQVKAYRVSDNKIKELSYWDDDLLKLELSKLENTELETLGFDTLDLNILGFGEEKEEQEKEYTEYEEENERKSTKLDINNFNDFEHKCPKCGFEFD